MLCFRKAVASRLKKVRTGHSLCRQTEKLYESSDGGAINVSAFCSMLPP